MNNARVAGTKPPTGSMSRQKYMGNSTSRIITGTKPAFR